MANYLRSDLNPTGSVSSSLFTLTGGGTVLENKIDGAATVNALGPQIFPALLTNSSVQVTDPVLSMVDGSTITLTGSFTVSRTITSNGPPVTGTLTVSGAATGLVRRDGANILETITGASISFSTDPVSWSHNPQNGATTFGPVVAHASRLDEIFSGDDTIIGNADSNSLRGYGGNDIIDGRGGEDFLFGDEGNDVIRSIAGEASPGEILNGGAGSDKLLTGGLVDFRNPSLVSLEEVDLNPPGFTSGFNLIRFNANQLDGVALSTSLLITGDSGATDSIEFNMEERTTLSLAQIAVANWSANDTLLVFGDDDAETITGSPHRDFLVAQGGADSLNGGGGDDTLDGGLGADILNGGTGLNTATFQSSTAGVTVNLELGIGAGGTAQGDTYINIQNVIGGGPSAVLVGKAGVANVLTGTAGGDTFYGEGLDTFSGFQGSDTLFGSLGSALNVNLATAQIETAWGGFGADILNGAGALFNLTLVGQGPTGDTLTGGSGNDFAYWRAGDIIAGGLGNDWAVSTLSATGVTLNMAATGFENAWGSAFADTITAAGAAFNAVIVGDAGNDGLTGGNGNDFLYGFGDSDALTGGAGNDNLIGGPGADNFRFGANWGVDIVWDWVDGSERFNLGGSGVTNFGQLTVNQNLNGSGNALVSHGANRFLVVGGAFDIDALDFDFF